MNSGKNIPGYTGFVPFKSEFFGQTTCQSNRAAEQTYRVQASGNKFSSVGKTILEINSGDVVQRSTSVCNEKEFPQHKLMIGNKSKNSKTWINGPTHEIRNQCLPGYTGFIPGVKSENVFAQTYAHNTAQSFAYDIPRGAEGSPEERFKTVGSDKFSPRTNRRIMDNDRHANRRDYIEYTIAVNNQLKQQRDDFLK